MLHDSRESEDGCGQSTSGPAEVDLYRQALTVIRESGHNYDPVVRWMQQIAASVLQPGVVPPPVVRPPEFDPKKAVAEAVVFHLWQHYGCALSEARALVGGAQDCIAAVVNEIAVRIATQEGWNLMSSRGKSPHP
jgi:hypothetical protein